MIGRHDVLVKEQGEIKRIRVPVHKPENMGRFMAIDEKTVDGVCYTILSNRETSKIALMADTLKVSELTKCMEGFPLKSKMNVKSISRDLSASYEWFARTTFMNAYHVADKFHVICELLEQLQSTRIRYRQKVLALERKKDKTTLEKLSLKERLPNGDTLKQLLHRSRGLLYKQKSEWTKEQSKRAQILFRHYPEIKEAYDYCCRIRKWYTPIRPRYTDQRYLVKKVELELIIKEGAESEVEEIQNIARYLMSNASSILHYFYRRESNAKAEALNQNLQRFISVNYGTRNSNFFLYRIALHFS